MMQVYKHVAEVERYNASGALHSRNQVLKNVKMLKKSESVNRYKASAQLASHVDSVKKMCDVMTTVSPTAQVSPL